MKRKNEEYHKTKIDKLCDILMLSLIPFVIIIMICIILSNKVNASTVNSSTLPYYVDNTSFEFGGYSVTDIQNYINNKFINDGAPQYSVDFTNNLTLMYTGVENGQTYLAIYTKSNTIDTNYYFSNFTSSLGTFDVSTDTCTLSFTKCYRILLKINTNNTLGWKTWYPNQVQNVTLFGTYYTPLYINDIFYNQSYVGGVINTSDEVILTNYLSPSAPVFTGHATPPDNFNIPVYTQGHSRPEHVPPTITVNNYTWSTYTPPTVDNSTLEKLLESLTDIVKYNANYLKDNLHNEFTNLINNIKNLIDYIGQTIQYYGDLIIENIQNSINTFYNNMVSLFEPISLAIDYISQPLQVEEVVTAIESTNIHTDVTSIVNLSNTAFGIFGTVSEPSSFTIPLDLTGIAILHQTQPFYIDLSWINSAKSYIRAFMWCIVTFGLLYSIVIGIPSMLKDSK